MADLIMFEHSGSGEQRVFNPAVAFILQPQESPAQKLLLAQGGQSYVYEIATGTSAGLYTGTGTGAVLEAELLMEFLDLPVGNPIVNGVINNGFRALSTFLRDVVNWSVEPFTVYNVGDTGTFAVRYWGGYETFREASGRSQRQGQWQGTIRLRKIL